MQIKESARQKKAGQEPDFSQVELGNIGGTALLARISLLLMSISVSMMTGVNYFALFPPG